MSADKKTFLLVVAAVFLIACCMRTPIVSVGPLVGMIQVDLGRGSALMGMIGTVPVLVFAFCSPFAAPLARRFGLEEVLIAALLILGAGIWLRTAGISTGFFLGGTLLLSTGIAMGNVLVSGVIKRSMAPHMGRFTALYSITMSSSAAVSAAVSMPLAERFGWVFALEIWLLPVLAALAVWLALRVRQGHVRAEGAKAAGAHAVPVWRNKLAWAISGFMGLQSLVFYTFSVWLPAILAENGAGGQEAGYYAMLFQLAALPAIFCVTALSVRMKSQYVPVAVVTSASLAGMVNLWLLPYASALWVFVTGFGIAGTFTLSLLLFVQRTESASEAAMLSGMAQTAGYLLAAAGPAGAGWLYDATGSWDAALAVMTLLMLVKCGCGWYCARPVTLREAAGMMKDEK